MYWSSDPFGEEISIIFVFNKSDIIICWIYLIYVYKIIIITTNTSRPTFGRYAFNLKMRTKWCSRVKKKKLMKIYFFTCITHRLEVIIYLDGIDNEESKKKKRQKMFSSRFRIFMEPTTETRIYRSVTIFRQCIV